MLEAEVTILDYLNEDCWRAVLQHVPAKDLIRTERASRRWQGVVLTYLQGVHLTIEEEDGKHKKVHNLTCSLKDSGYASFLEWTNKLGTSVASVFCRNLENLPTLQENCPNLRVLQFSSVQVSTSEPCPDDILFKSLEQVSYYNCPIRDVCITQFLTDKALQKLEFRHCRGFSGLCFETLNVSNLESLVIEECRCLKKPKHLLSMFDRLIELKELKLIYTDDFYSNINGELLLVLYKMPKLESLVIHGGRMNEKFIEQLSQLTRLKHLSLTCQMEYRHVEAVMRGCVELCSLELLDCKRLMGVDVIGRHAGARLRALVLDHFSPATDDMVVELVRGCPALQSLTIGGAEWLTCGLPARAAAARHEAAPGRTLRLDLSYTNLSDEFFLHDPETERYGHYEEMMTQYEDLIVVLENTIDEYDDEDDADDDFDYDDFDFDFDDSSYDDYEDEEESEEVEEEEQED